MIYFPYPLIGSFWLILCHVVVHDTHRRMESHLHIVSWISLLALSPLIWLRESHCEEIRVLSMHWSQRWRLVCGCIVDYWVLWCGAVFTVQSIHNLTHLYFAEFVCRHLYFTESPYPVPRNPNDTGIRHRLFSTGEFPKFCLATLLNTASNSNLAVATRVMLIIYLRESLVFRSG